MSRMLNATEREIVRDHLSVNQKVVTPDGVGRVLKITRDACMVSYENGINKQWDINDVAPMLRGFRHLNTLDLYEICDIVLASNEPMVYKPNFNFFPSFVEVTEDAKKIKIQVYKTFNIIHCDTIAMRTPKAYSYLKRRGYDIEGLQEMGLAVIDPTAYAI